MSELLFYRIFVRLIIDIRWTTNTIVISYVFQWLNKKKKKVNKPTAILYRTINMPQEARHHNENIFLSLLTACESKIIIYVKYNSSL